MFTGSTPVSATKVNQGFNLGGIGAGIRGAILPPRRRQAPPAPVDHSLTTVCPQHGPQVVHRVTHKFHTSYPQGLATLFIPQLYLSFTMVDAGDGASVLGSRPEHIYSNSLWLISGNNYRYTQ